MRYLLSDNSLTIHVDNPRSPRPQVKAVPELLVLPAEQITIVLEATFRKLHGKEFKTRIQCVDVVLRSLGRFLKWSKQKELPRTFGEWQFFLSQWALWHISNPHSSMTLENRCDVWNDQICPWIEFLVNDDLIPLGLTIPDLRLPRQAVSGTSKPSIAGSSPVSVYKRNPKNMDNTLAGPILWAADVEYLDEFLAQLKGKDRVLADALDDYWSRLVADFRKGKQMMKLVSTDELLNRCEKNDWKEKVFLGLRRKTLVASPSHPNGAAWVLKIIEHRMTAEQDLNCIGLQALREHPAFLTTFARVPLSVKPFADATQLLSHQIENLSSYLLVMRFMGLLSSLDIAVAIAILIREHPNLNPESLAAAKLLCARGKYYLMPQGEGQSIIFSVDKPRAKSRKYCELSRRAVRVLKHILRVTHPVRELMKRAAIPQWRYLFLGIVTESGSWKLGHPVTINAGILHRSSGCTLLNYYPNLAEHGLQAGTLSFERIRNTQGVLSWFDEGSISACATTLGNTEEVSMKNYIPESLLNAWNERIIRRFQNTLLILAAAKEDYLLNAVDLRTTSDLNHFIAQLIFENGPEDSPISKKIHELFGQRYTFSLPSDTLDMARDGLLYVRLSSESLAILIGYKKWALENLDHSKLLIKDSVSGKCASDFVKLAEVIQALVSMTNPSVSVREAHDIARLKRVYLEAEVLVPNVSSRFSSLSISMSQEKIECFN
jgi:hypothetical protein